LWSSSSSWLRIYEQLQLVASVRIWRSCSLKSPIKLRGTNAISCCIISPSLAQLKAERGSFRCVCSPQSVAGNSRHPSAILSFYGVVTSLLERKPIICQVRVLDTCFHLLTCRATVLCPLWHGAWWASSCSWVVDSESTEEGKLNSFI